jgi:CBS domain containing-hemolysin-like protein
MLLCFLILFLFDAALFYVSLSRRCMIEIKEEEHHLSAGKLQQNNKKEYEAYLSMLLLATSTVAIDVADIISATSIVTIDVANMYQRKTLTQKWVQYCTKWRVEHV